MHSIDLQCEFRHLALLSSLFTFFDDIRAEEIPAHLAKEPGWGTIVERTGIGSQMRREFPDAPLMGVGAVIVDKGRVLLVQRGSEPMKGHWTLPGGLVELGEPIADGVTREVREETGLLVKPVELVELLDRIYREGERVRYHYVIADYLCLIAGGTLQAASDAAAVRWIERAEWTRPSALKLDSITVRVIEKGWQRAQTLAATEK